MATMVNAQSNVQTGDLIIQRLINFGLANSDGEISEALFVIPNEPIRNPRGCGRNNRYVMADDTSDISRAMLLAAKLNGTPIRFVIHGFRCSDNDFPLILAVELPDS